MANEEVLGPRKTMFVLVIVVGCFAVLWPRILSPLILGHTRDQLKPNQYDREAGCCEVIFETEVAVLELLTEVCSSAIGADGKLSPMAAAECRKSVNESCGLDIAAFFKRNDNVGKTTKLLVETMKNSNSSCLKERFGVPVWSLSSHQALNSWTQQDTLKQERPIMRGAGPHPALRERGRAIPAGAPTPPSRGPVPLPAHARVWSSPLSVYFELDIKPPPIPGMRPPLGSPGGPVAAPKSSMGFVMPIYTICIIVFFVYTLSKILFKRTGSVPYEPIQPDPQFRRRVFRDDSRSSPDTKLVVTAISGLVAEVQQQMEASYAPNQQRQDVQDNLTRPYTNGTVLSNSTTPVQIIASEYREPSKEKSPEPQKEKEQSPEPVPEPRAPIPEPEPQESKPAPEPVQENESNESNEARESTPETKEFTEVNLESEAKTEPAEILESKETRREPDIDLLKLTEDIVKKDVDLLVTSTDDFLDNAREEFKIVSTHDLEEKTEDKQSTQELLEEALKEDSPTKERNDVTEDQENATVKHEAEEVKSIYLETEIPQQSRVLVTDFVEDRADRPTPTKHSPLVVSGKMTLSLIQDAPRETPERDPESTMDEFTTASAVTQPAAEKEGNLSEDEVDEEIEVEEIEVEEIEVEEIEDEMEEPKKTEEVVVAEKIEKLKEATEETNEIKEAAEKTEELEIVEKTEVKKSVDGTDEVKEVAEEIKELKEEVESTEDVKRIAETAEVKEAVERIEEVKQAIEETKVEESLEKTDEIKETAEKTEEVKDVIEKRDEVKETVKEIEEIKEAAEETEDSKEAVKETEEVTVVTEKIDEVKEAAEKAEEIKETVERIEELKESLENTVELKDVVEKTDEGKETIEEINESKEAIKEMEEVKEIAKKTDEVKETTERAEEVKETVERIEEVKEAAENTEEIKDVVEKADEVKETVEDIKEVKQAAEDTEESKEAVKETEEVMEAAKKTDEVKDTVEEIKDVKEAANTTEVKEVASTTGVKQTAENTEVKEAAATTEEVTEAAKKSGKRRKRGKVQRTE